MLIFLLCLQLKFGESLLVLVVFYVLVWLNMVWLCISFWVLFDAFRRINRLTDQAHLNIDTNMVRLHLSTYAAFLVTLLLF